MRILQPLIYRLWVLCMVLFIFHLPLTTSFNPEFETHESPSKAENNRFAEIEEQCANVISLGSELNHDDVRVSRMEQELSFMNGDWYQDPYGTKPLIPFDDINIKHSCSMAKLVSFWVEDVSPIYQSNKTINISGKMTIGITGGHGMFNYDHEEKTPNIHRRSGSTIHTMFFEGVYVESEENGGKRLLCMLGTGLVPISDQFVDEFETRGCSKDCEINPSQVEDDQIMLILKYPKLFSLATDGIIGEMRSLRGKANVTYFDLVHISSRLSRQNKYNFGAGEIFLKACNPYPSKDKLVEEEAIDMFEEDGFCNIFQSSLSSSGIFKFFPKWETFNTSTSTGDKLGPFVVGNEEKACSEDTNDYGLLIQDFTCEENRDKDKVKSANVSAVFRLIKSHKQEHTMRERTGISGMTLSVEGMWRSSSGQVCMVGCIGLNGETSERCNSRICLFLPLIFSIHQRSIIFGTISSLNDNELFPPLHFETPAYPTRLLEMYEYKKNEVSSDVMLRRMKRWSYNYTKTMEAIAFQNNSKPSSLGIYKKSLLSYPSHNSGHISNLSCLSDDLTFDVFAVPYASSEARNRRTYVEMSVFSLGPLFGRYLPQSDQNHQYSEVLFHSPVNSKGIEISGHLIVKRNFINLYLSIEGVYDPIIGEMYLVGCKHCITRNDTTKLEKDKDCEIEIKVNYPPTSATWLFSPQAKIFISSKRSVGDSLYFSPINLITYPILKACQLDDLILRKTIEGYLRIIMLQVASFCSWSQFHYTTANTGDPSHQATLSLVMLGIQALGYGIPLVIGNVNDVFFKWKVIPSDRRRQLFYPNQFEHIRLTDFITRILLLVPLANTLLIAQKVHKSRTTKRIHNQKQRMNIPNEKWGFIISLVVHIGGFLVAHTIVMVIPQLENYKQKPLRWLQEIDIYGGVVQDFFLLPQIICNTLWQIQGKPLRKLYYMGFTALRIFLHAYDYIRDPIPEPFFDFEEYQRSHLELLSKSGNVVVAFMVVVLALIVFLQQNWQKKLKKPGYIAMP